MAYVSPLADHLAPDSISRLERAAQRRFEEADILSSTRRHLAAIYLYGYVVEMCLTAAVFRNAGFPRHAPIDRDTRQRRMAQARQLGVMSSDAHPLSGWARFLLWQRSARSVPKNAVLELLRSSVSKAEAAYRHWRPELRYKLADVTPEQVREVRQAAAWFLEHQNRL